MNHFDDRASYIAHLREQGQIMSILDNNLQQDVSLCAAGASIGSRGQPLPMVSDWQQDV